MELIYCSEKIKEPDIYLVNDMRETINSLTIENKNDYEIRLSLPLFRIYREEIIDEPKYDDIKFMGIKCSSDFSIKDDRWVIWRINKNEKIFNDLDDWWDSLGLTERNWIYYHFEKDFKDNNTSS